VSEQKAAAPKPKTISYSVRLPEGLGTILKQLRRRAKSLDAVLYDRQAVITTLYRYVKQATEDLDGIEAKLRAEQAKASTLTP